MDTRRHFVAGAGTLSVLGLTTSLLDTPAWSEPEPARRPATGAVPNVPLTTHTGARVRFYDDLVRGKVVLINMMYAGCNRTCPPMTYNLVEVQKQLGQRVGRDIFMYSITLRPEQDSPEDLAHYARLHQVKPGWLFLTGAKADIEKLRFALGYYDPDPAVDQEEGRHVGMVRIGNDPFKRWGMAPALASPRQIVSMVEHIDRRPPPARRTG
ncbi:SCO family protein [Ramlibacter montanisoli]|uniref:SCO family protein n=1 Tax=Ramlibacter montanisoli TaxID=2732512 RepID=A0A849KA25_9BURK|nr:SCO family protein [Ramlibacter montanisoli]NNU43274.1 SCO family protein [Ramlibacter montanisoli]